MIGQPCADWTAGTGSLLGSSYIVKVKSRDESAPSNFNAENVTSIALETRHGLRS